MNKHLADSFSLTYLAYENRDEEILIKDYGISKIINFKKEISDLINEEIIDLQLIKQIDKLIIEQTENRFCLNSCIQSDRTLAGKDYNEILTLVQVYYKFWNNFIVKEQYNLLLHEPVSLFFLQIASVLSRKYGSEYLTQIQVFGEDKFNWIFVAADSGFAVEMPKLLESKYELSQKDQNRVLEYIKNFRNNFVLLLPEIASKRKSSSHPKLLSFSRQVLKAAIKEIYNSLTKKPKSFELHEHVEDYLSSKRTKFSERLKNLWDEFFNFEYDIFEADRDYYYYPMHTEPEAVVLYWGDGLYKNQIKLIENIAGQLPPNCYLYVKYHPVLKEDRNYIDYKRIKAIPNVKLIGPQTLGREIVSKAKGIMTINGTSGFEGILLNKPVFVFGNSFYDLSDRVIKVKNIRDLREIIYNYHLKAFKDDIALYKFVSAFLNISHPGYTAYYSNYRDRLNIDNKKNAGEVASYIEKYLNQSEILN